MFTLEQLATLTKSSFNGDKDMQIDSVAALSEAKPGQISFVSNIKYRNQLETTKASVVILNEALAKEFDGNVLINQNPYLTFAHVVEILHTEEPSTPSLHKSAIIDETAIIDKTASIGPNVVIDEGVTIAAKVTIDAGCYIGANSKIADGAHIYPNTVIYKNTIIGKNAIIHSNVTLGADGFGFAPTAEKEWFKILQIGNLVIGDDVEIGANTTIDRATLGSTEIKKGVKLDNHIHIGHNVTIDEHTIMAAGTVVGGSTHIGKRCQIGGAAALAGHILIADDIILTGRAMVMKSIKTAGVYSSGVAVEENKKWRRNAARFRSLDELAKKVKQLDKKINDN